MKHVLAACILLLPVVSANAITARSDRFRTEKYVNPRLQQPLQNTAQISGYLLTAPAVDKATADTSTGGKRAQAPRIAPQPAPVAARIPQSGSSGARAQ